MLFNSLGEEGVSGGSGRGIAAGVGTQGQGGNVTLRLGGSGRNVNSSSSGSLASSGASGSGGAKQMSFTERFLIKLLGRIRFDYKEAYAKSRIM